MGQEVDVQVQDRGRMFPGGSHRSAQHAGHCYAHLETPFWWTGTCLSWGNTCQSWSGVFKGIAWGAGLIVLVKIFSFAAQVIAILGSEKHLIAKV